MSRKVKLRIWRGDAKEGKLEDVSVEANEGEVVLDVIHRVQGTQMPDQQFVGIVKLVSVAPALWKSTENLVLPV